MVLTLTGTHPILDLSQTSSSEAELGLPPMEARAKEGLEVARQIQVELGEQALAELMSFGEVLEKDITLRHKLEVGPVAAGAVTSAQSAKLLSPYIPDTMIALHAREQMYATHLVQNADVYQFKVSDIVAAATILSELRVSSSFSDISGALQCEFGSNSKKAAIWNSLSVSELTAIMELQREAYFERLRIQPGDHVDLTLAQDIAKSSYGKSLASLLTVHLTETLSQLTPSQLAQVYDLGRRLQTSTFITPTHSEVFGSAPFRLKADNLSLHEGDLALIHHLARSQFVGFRDYKSALSGDGQLSFTVESSPLKDSIDEPTNNSAERYFNFNLINAYTLAKHLPRLSEGVTNKLKELVSGNPETKSLAKITTHILEPTEIKRDYFGGQLNPEGIVAWERRIEAFRSYQQDQLYSNAQRIVNWSDKATGEGAEVMRSQTFISGLSLLRELSEQSSYLCNELRIAGRTQTELSELLVTSDREILSEVLGTLPEEVTKRLQAVKQRYERTEHQLHTLLESQPLEIPLGSTELIRDEILESDWKKIKDIVRATLRPDYDPDYSKRGGVVFDYYDTAFIESFLSEGNHLAAHRSAEDGSICGFFMYYLPGRIPENHTNVPEHMRSQPDFSYAQLIAVSPDRPSGTYDKLFRAMMTYAQVERVMYSEGCVNTSNMRQIQNLHRLGHTSQPLAEYATQASKQTTSASVYRPMVLALNPYSLHTSI